MMTSVVLAGYAVLAALLLPRLLRRMRWADRAPRLAISVWLAACVSAVASAVFAGLTVAIPADTVGHGLLQMFEMCAALLGDGTEVPAASLGFRLAVLASGLVAARAAYCVGAVLIKAGRERHRHAAALDILGRRDGDLGAVVVDFGEPLVYCVPGRNGKAVITTAALASLLPQHVAAVLAHERAHLRGRHHLVLAVAGGLARAFPRLPLFAAAREETVRLIELRADDVAAHRHPRAHIAAALVGLATGRVPAFALGAGGDNALTRVRRMLHPAAPLGRREKLMGKAMVGVLAMGPAVVAAIPGVGSFVAHHCHTLALL